MAGQSALLRLSIHVNNLDAYLDKSYVACARGVSYTRSVCGMLDRATRVDGREQGVMGNNEKGLPSYNVSHTKDEGSCRSLQYFLRSDEYNFDLQIGSGRIEAGFLFPSLPSFPHRQLNN